MRRRRQSEDVERFRETGDRYAVRELEADRFEVTHYPDPDPETSPCCRVVVELTDADRAKAIPDADPHGKAACLARADAAIQARHRRIVDNNGRRA